jgi:hypothetical protein
MDLSKAFNISADYKERRTPPLWEQRIFTEVVFIDKTQASAPSTLYQLKENVLSLNEAIGWKTGSSFFPKEAFMPLGEVVFIDKKKKEILLSNKNIVAYNYLVVAAGNRPDFSVHEDEFIAGLQALIDALRMKPKIPSSFAPFLNQISKHQPKSSDNNKSDQPQSNDIDKIVHPYISSSGARSIAFELNSINRRLFEVHL